LEFTRERERVVNERVKELENLNHEKDNQIAGLELCNENLGNRVKELEDGVKLLLSFAPLGPVPYGLIPTFYYTTTYEGDLELQNKIDLMRKVVSNEKAKG
jgi:hypothetical protein